MRLVACLSSLLIAISSPAEAGGLSAGIGAGASQMYVYGAASSVSPFAQAELGWQVGDAGEAGLFLIYNYLTQASGVGQRNAFFYGVFARSVQSSGFPVYFSFRMDPFFTLILVICGLASGGCAANTRWTATAEFPFSAGAALGHRVPLAGGGGLRIELGLRYFFSPFPVLREAQDPEQLRMAGIDLGFTWEL